MPAGPTWPIGTAADAVVVSWAAGPCWSAAVGLHVLSLTSFDVTQEVVESLRGVIVAVAGTVSASDTAVCPAGSRGLAVDQS